MWRVQAVHVGITLLVCASALLPGQRAAAQAQEVPQEVTLNLLSQGEPDSLDPNRASFAFAVDGAVIRQVFEPLLRFDATLVPQPAAAESYDVSLDGTTYTFHLRADGRWSDGQPVTAGQFEYSWKRLLDPALHAEYAPLFVDAGIVGADDYNRGRTATPARVGITAVDGQTLQVRLTQPFGAFPDLAALYVGAPLRPDLVSADPDGWASDPSTYVGNGPFMLADWRHQDRISLVPNPRYAAHLGWPRPTLTLVTLLMNNAGASPDWTLVPDTQINTVLNDPMLASQSRQTTQLTTFWLQFNNARAPLDNALVRRALSKAIDRGALIRDLAAGIGVPATSIIPPGMPGFQAGLGHELGIDPSGAQALLAQAGLGDGSFPTLSYVYPDSSGNARRAQYVQSQLAQNLGITLDLNGVDEPTYQQVLDARDYDLTAGGWNADYPDPQDWFSLAFGCKATHNTLNYCDATFDQTVAQADSSVALPDRLRLYAQAQTRLMQDVPVAPLFVRGRLVLVKPWVRSTDGTPLTLTPLDEYPGSLFLDKVQILPH